MLGIGLLCFVIGIIVGCLGLLAFIGSGQR